MVQEVSAADTGSAAALMADTEHCAHNKHGIV
jgi:hypothetical protein